MTPEQDAALDVARGLVSAGVPMFLGRRDESRPTGYALPPGWQRQEPDASVVDAWRPGWALCMVTGHKLDVIDLDPRSGGVLPIYESMPILGRAHTPSGGSHLFVRPLDVESLNGAWPGVDVKSGSPDGQGRGFAFVAPTVRASKVSGEECPYCWEKAPTAFDVGSSRQYALVGGLAEVRQRVLDLRSADRTTADHPRRLARSQAEREWRTAVEVLAENVARWRASGWGGEAHQGLLEATKHLVLLSPEHAERGLWDAFRRGGATPDADDLAKLESALDKYADRADVVVDDAELSGSDRFWAGGRFEVPADPKGPPPEAGGEVPADPDERAAALEQAVERELFRREVRQAADARAHARAWVEPVSHGSLADELALPEVGPAWRIEGLLPAGGNAVLVAGRKAGKTTMVVDLTWALVDKQPFLGRFEATPVDGAVALFNYELTERQQRGWLREAAISGADHVFHLPLRDRTLPLSNPRVRDWVVRWLREREVRFWIVDPYSRAYVGSVDNGNDEAQVSTFLGYLDQIKAEAGVGELVMPVHAPKAARWDPEALSAIGSQRLEAWPDVLWYLGRDGDSQARYFRAEGRDVLVPEGALVRVPRGDDNGVFNPVRLSLVDRTTASTKVDRDIAVVVAYVTDHPGRGTNRVTADLGLGKGRASLLLTMAEDEGLIYHVQGDNRSKLWHPTSGGPGGPGGPVDHV